ncbi:MAG TPA: hypothetical protein VKW70_03690 [Terriglobia bacterium]|nr:hypothetical protein [Terriglobia bacterium]
MVSLASWLMFFAGAGLLLPLFSAAPASVGSSRGLLLVENKGEHTLGIVDPEAGKMLTKITLSGVTGHEVAASPDGRFAYAPIYGNSGVGAPGSNGKAIDVIDLRSRRVAHKIDLRPVRPHCPVYGPDGMLYVTAELDHAVYVIDPHTLKVVGSISTEQPESHMLAITRDGKRGYTANVGAGTVTALDLENRKPIAVIHVSRVVQRISVTPDGRWVFTADQTEPRLAVIDTSTNQVKSWIHLPGVAFGTTVSPDGHWLLATLPKLNRVAVIELPSMRVTRTIDVPKAPQEILFRPGGQVAYVSCDSSAKIAVVNLEDWRVEKLIAVGRGDDGLAWASM